MTPLPATLKLTKPVKRADIFIPNDGDEIVRTFANTDTLELAVPDRYFALFWMDYKDSYQPGTQLPKHTASTCCSAL